MLTDYHCHILPKMDDGSESVEMSIKMLEMMKLQGVDRIIATPHFYAHRERSVERFLERRRKCCESLMLKGPLITNILLGAEIAVEKDISDLDNIERLAIQGTKLILFELPYKAFSDWMIEEIENISSEHKLIPIIAHVHRYLPYYTKDDYEKVLKADAIFQVNAEAFGNFREFRFVKKLIKNEFPLVLGSDAHNVTDRKPDYDLIMKKSDRKIIENSNEILGKSKRVI